MTYNTKILHKEFVTHDVQSFIVEKPDGFEFEPGQFTRVAVKKEGWSEKTRPFTFTSLPEDKILQFTIKEYPSHHGVTEQIHSLEPGDEIVLQDAYGTIQYAHEGVFIAGGAGVTPFIAILRNLHRQDKIANNMLIFSNKEAKDIILEKEFDFMFSEKPENLIYTLTREENDQYLSRRIDEEFLKDVVGDFDRHFYICGPEKFRDDMIMILEKLGAKSEAIVFER